MRRIFKTGESLPAIKDFYSWLNRQKDWFPFWNGSRTDSLLARFFSDTYGNFREQNQTYLRFWCEEKEDMIKAALPQDYQNIDKILFNKQDKMTVEEAKKRLGI